jgi:RimJ/RimL family protein N-acetyltransferase
MPRLETKRLVLRAFKPSDACDVQRLAGDPAISDTTLNIPHPYEDGMAEEWISTHRPDFEAGKSVTLAITLRDTGQVVGAISLHMAPRFDRAELGYWVGKPFWNKGYCTEAALALLRYGFETLGLNRIHAHYFSGNPSSGIVMKKIGMSQEGILRQHVKKAGRYVDLVNYAILRGDWQRGKGGPPA